ncbi:hypothetical protein [Synechococcus sp. M16CYN]|uniref:hypothetical protein n=1 Tax=Synechococcus sp. M16CYN TaxID=3103139 RepID=UPI0033415CD7
MGTISLPIILILLGTTVPALIPEPLTNKRFQWLLTDGTIAELEQACLNSLDAEPNWWRGQLRDRLLAIHPVPARFDLTLRNAEALLRCGFPEGVALVLNRFSPRVGEERQSWLMLRWQAAAATLNHRQAALALRRLVNGDLRILDQITLPGKRNGLDQLAEHEASVGRTREAASIVLAGELQGIVGARRKAKAADWLAASNGDQANQLLEVALDMATSKQAWGLAMEVLRLQLRLQLEAGGDGERPRQRMKRLAAHLDDTCTLLQLDSNNSTQLSSPSPRELDDPAAARKPMIAPLL